MRVGNCECAGYTRPRLPSIRESSNRVFDTGVAVCYKCAWSGSDPFLTLQAPDGCSHDLFSKYVFIFVMS